MGSVTPLPQPGNIRPRVFRLSKDKGIINRFDIVVIYCLIRDILSYCNLLFSINVLLIFRYGFNSSGHEDVLKSLFGNKQRPQGVVGVNLGKNKGSGDAVSDYLKGNT